MNDEASERLIEKPVCPHCGREMDSWDDYWEMKCCKKGVLPGHVRDQDRTLPTSKEDGVFGGEDEEEETWQ